MARKLIIDCDPGIDDAIALLLAMASPEDVDLLGITVVGGNVGVERTLANALAVTELAGHAVPVVAGADRPMVVELQTVVAMEKELRFAIREGGRTVGSGVVVEIVE